MVDAVRGSDVPVTVRKRAGCISLLARFPMKVERVLNVTLGYQAATAFSSLNPGIGGVDCHSGRRSFTTCVNKVKPCS